LVEVPGVEPGDSRL